MVFASKLASATNALAKGAIGSRGGTTKPIFAYPHSRDGSCSVIGGYVVADPALPSLRGKYVYADYCEGQLRALTPHLHRASGDHQADSGADDAGNVEAGHERRLQPVQQLLP